MFCFTKEPSKFASGPKSFVSFGKKSTASERVEQRVIFASGCVGRLPRESARAAAGQKNNSMAEQKICLMNVC